MNTCIDCGYDYNYDPNNPLGSSSVRCCKCRKKQSKLNIKFNLLEIAGDGNVSCRKCGYSRSVSALKLLDAVDPIVKPKTKQQLEAQARKQFIVCLNCEAEIQSDQVSIKTTNHTVYPVLVSFYESKVVVQEIETPFNSPSFKMEVTKDSPEIHPRVSMPLLIYV